MMPIIPPLATRKLTMEELYDLGEATPGNWMRRRITFLQNLPMYLQFGKSNTNAAEHPPSRFRPTIHLWSRYRRRTNRSDAPVRGS